MDIVNTKRRLTPYSETTLFYGDGGVGKSTLATSIPKSIVADFDMGLRAVDAKAIPYYDVEKGKGEGHAQFVRDVEESYLLAKDKKWPYKLWVVDTLTKWVSSIENYLMTEYNESAMNQGALAYGQGNVKCFEIIRTTINKMRRVGGVILLSHQKTSKYTNDIDVECNQYVPLVSDSFLTKLYAEVDHIVRLSTIITVNKAGEKVEQRILTGQPSNAYAAKSRGGIYTRNMLASWGTIVEAYKLTYNKKGDTDNEKEE